MYIESEDKTSRGKKVSNDETMDDDNDGDSKTIGAF